MDRLHEAPPPHGRSTSRLDLDEAQQRRLRGDDRMGRRYERERWEKRAEEVRRRVDIETVVGADVALKRAGSKTRQGRCPFHDDGTASFTVYPEGGQRVKVGFFICYGCQAKGDVIHYVMRRQGLDWTAAIELLESRAGLAALRASAPPRPRPAVPQAEDQRKLAVARQLWLESTALTAGGVVDLYLRRRAIVPPADYGIGDAAINAGWPVDLRFHPRCWHYVEERHFPAMVAAIRNHAGELLTVHRTYLDRRGDGSWTKAAIGKAKLVVGSWPPGFIALGPIESKMIGGEGIETSLSAMQLSRRSGLAFVNSGRMKSTDLPFLCDDFIYAADKGGKGRWGEVFANEGARANGHARAVAVKVPNLPLPKCDFNDLLMHRAGLLDIPAETGSTSQPEVPKVPAPACAAIWNDSVRRDALRARDRAKLGRERAELHRKHRSALLAHDKAKAAFDAVGVDDVEARVQAKAVLDAAAATLTAAAASYRAARKRQLA